MRIKASVGRAPKLTDLRDRAASLSLAADTDGDRQFLAALYRWMLAMGSPEMFESPWEYELKIEKKRLRKATGR